MKTNDNGMIQFLFIHRHSTRSPDGCWRHAHGRAGSRGMTSAEAVRRFLAGNSQKVLAENEVSIEL
jgi:hypothetical protein